MPALRYPLSAPSSSIKKKLESLGLSPRKALGQHFMVDGNVVRKILHAAELSPDDTVLEIGPGLGVLTEELARRAGRVVAVELDHELAKALMHACNSFGNVRVVQGDAREIEPESLLGDSPYKMVANLPYYAANPILRHFLEARYKPMLMVITVQKEVAQNITATPGKLGILGVSVQVYGRPEIVDYVRPGTFYPPPKVSSAIVKIRVYPKPLFDGDMTAFFNTVKSGFSAPRKQLRNALCHGLKLAPIQVEEALKRARIEPTRRAETLSLEEWGTLTRVLAGLTGVRS